MIGALIATVTLVENAESTAAREDTSDTNSFKVRDDLSAVYSIVRRSSLFSERGSRSLLTSLNVVQPNVLGDVNIVVAFSGHRPATFVSTGYLSVSVSMVFLNAVSPRSVERDGRTRHED